MDISVREQSHSNNVEKKEAVTAVRVGAQKTAHRRIRIRERTEAEKARDQQRADALLAEVVGKFEAEEREAKKQREMAKAEIDPDEQKRKEEELQLIRARYAENEARSPYRHAAIELTQIRGNSREQTQRGIVQYLVRHQLDVYETRREVLDRYCQILEMSRDETESFVDELGPFISRASYLRDMGLSSPVDRPAAATDWLVPGVIPRGTVGAVFAPKNHLKTSISLDIGVSLATDTAALGYFPTAKIANVAIFHAEDREDHVDDTIHRILASRDLSRDALGGLTDRLVTTSRVPAITDEAWLHFAIEAVSYCQIDLLVLEASYLAMGNADQRSLVSMGNAFAPVKTLSDVTGCAVILTAHTKQSISLGCWPQLGHISGVGLEEVSRFWLGLNSRAKWDSTTGWHQLMLLTGNKLGESRYLLDVREGHPSAPGGRIWSPQVAPADERPKVGAPGKIESADEAPVAKLSDEERVAEFLGRPEHADGASATAIAKGTNLARKIIAPLLSRMVADNRLTPCKIRIGNQKTANRGGFRLAKQQEP